MSNFGVETPLDMDELKANGQITFSRVWAMPCLDTFDVPPIMGFVQKYLLKSKVSVDPFARNKRLATYTNDLNPNTAAQYHMDSTEFLEVLRGKHVRADLVIFDPPYSPTQMQRAYEGFGLKMNGTDALRTAGWKSEKDILAEILNEDGVFLHFGWHSSGMGEKRGFSLEEILLVCHGAGHNDTICLAERRKEKEPTLWDACPQRELAPTQSGFLL